MIAEPTAGRINGNETRQSVGQLPAPATAEASSSRGSIDCSAAESNRYASGVISRE